ncbi:adenosine 5'-monophosphoramidase HINT1-like [Hippocampus zosterae]|uniref:adenosine 5'-monophosphoramidase HINT1-like n=1 Tax=Hippocampus zosterae TaxID=109293 RepID=UPI00223CAEBF|nr:adenosine 5'-monophosphoramidase HINT1-like [Hippocampus zosterae]
MLRLTSTLLRRCSVFEKISKGELPARVVYEDEQCQVIHDISPVSPVHLLVYPRKKIARLSTAEEGDHPLLGHLLGVAAKTAKAQGLEGYRVVINVGEDGGQTIDHLHLHVVGGRKQCWPPG